MAQNINIEILMIQLNPNLCISCILKIYTCIKFTNNLKFVGFLVIILKCIQSADIHLMQYNIAL